MSKIDNKFIRLSNNGALQARNAADSADIDIVKLNASNVIEFASQPQYNGLNFLTESSTQSVRAVALSNQNLASSIQNIDSVSLSIGDLVLFKGQSVASQNGVYVENGSGNAYTRAPGWSTASDFKVGKIVHVRQGLNYSGTSWTLTTNVTTLGTDPITFLSSGFDYNSLPNVNFLPRLNGGVGLGTVSLPFGATYQQNMWISDGSGTLLQRAYLNLNGSAASGNPPYSGAADGLFTLSTRPWYISSLNTNGSTASPALGMYTGHVTSGGLTTGAINLATGNQGGSGPSGDILLNIGTVSSGTRGKIKLQDGSQGTVGHVWTQTAADGSGAWQAAGGGGANTSLSNLASTSINADLLPSANNTRKLGNNSSLQFLEGNILRTFSQVSPDIYMDGYLTGVVTGRTGVGISSRSDLFGVASNPLYVTSGDNSVNNTVPTGDIQILTGAKTVGTANSGSITLQTGTATATRGKIKLVDGTQGTVGQVWAQSVSDGTGSWSNPASGATNAIQFSNSGLMNSDATNFTFNTSTKAFQVGSSGVASSTTLYTTNGSPLTLRSNANSQVFQSFTDGTNFTHFIGAESSGGTGIFGSGNAYQLTIGTNNAQAIGFHTSGASVPRLTITGAGGVTLWNTVTPGGTNGAQTINKPSGTVNIGAGGTSVVVTNSLVTTSSIVFAVLRTNDTTATIKNVVPAAGSFTINLGAAATAAVSIGFLVIN